MFNILNIAQMSHPRARAHIYRVGLYEYQILSNDGAASISIVPTQVQRIEIHA